MRRVLTIVTLLLGLAACAETGTSRPAPGFAQSRLDAATYRVRYTGSTGETGEAVEAQMLAGAARLARDRGYSHFAVLNRRLETTAGPVAPTIGAQVPIVRSKSRSSRRSGGGFSYLELGRTTVFAAVATIRLYRGEPPAEADAVYDARTL